MSTADDLPTALDALSLNSPSAPLSLDSRFTLLCSDGVRVSVDAAALSSTSSIFKDMLETGSGEMECNIDESATEIRQLLDILLHGSFPKQEAQWRLIWRLYDKYEMPSLKPALAAGAWCNLHWNPLFAFACGIYLEDRDLIETAAEHSLGEDLLRQPGTSLYSNLPGPSREALAYFHSSRLDAAHSVLRAMQFPKKVCTCTWSTANRAFEQSDRKIWEKAHEAVLLNLQPSSDPVKLLREEIDSYTVLWRECERCEVRLRKKLDELDRRWANAAGKDASSVTSWT